MTAASPSHDSHPFLALGLRLLAMVMLSIMFAAVKWVSERGVHIVETLFYRQLLSLPVVLASAALGPGLASLRTARIGIHASRTAVGMIGMVLNFGAVILLPLAEATTIGFSVPIFATLFSVFFLGERPGVHRWLAVLTGFVGVMIIVGSPADFHAPLLGFSVAVGASVVTSVVSILLRQLGRTEQPATTVFYFAALSVPPMGVAMLWFGQAHDPVTWLLLVVMGVSGGLAQLLMTAALRWGPVSLVLPMDYSALLWSTMLGWLLWRNWPGSTTWVGAVVIASSSLYIVWRERVRQREVNLRGVAVS